MEAPGSDLESMLAILREHGLRAEISNIAELHEQLGCAQIRLESGFHEAKPFPYQVFVRRVDLDPNRLTEPVEEIVKFAPRRFSPVTYDSLQLGTPAYNRGYEATAPASKTRTKECTTNHYIAFSVSTTQKLSLYLEIGVRHIP